MNNSYDEILGREIVTTRVFDAPRTLVFEAWTDPEQLKSWWGPHGFTNTFYVFEFRPGGVWNYTMHGPNGVDYENKMCFVEIVPSERIVIDHLTPPKFRLTALFEDLGASTKLTFRQLFDSAATYNSIKHLATQGNEGNFDRLAAHLAGRRNR